MALENTDPRVTVTVANGVLYAFNFNWKILAETELSVYVETAAASDAFTLKAITTDYTVEFDAEAENGTVTFRALDDSLVAIAPPGNGARVVIIGVTPGTQGTSLQRVGAFPAKIIEASFDKLTLITGDLAEQLSRCLKSPRLPPSPDPIEVAAPTDSKALKYQDNEDGTWTVIPSTYDPDEQAALAAISAAAAAASASSAATAAAAASTSATAAAASATVALAAQVAAEAAASTVTSAEQSGLFAAKPAAPSTIVYYYSTDHDSYEKWVPAAGRWFLLG